MAWKMSEKTLPKMYSQKPVDSNDETNVTCRETNSSQNEHHGNQSCTGHTGGTHTGQCGRETGKKGF